jgi:RNA polymerase sigma-70 factor (ECF subfamily)
MDYRLLADEVLLKLLKISDELAFKELYLRYWKNLYTSALNKINSKEIAEDIVQTVFTDLWEKREKHSIENISAYLDTAVKYRVINYIKSAISKKAHHLTIGERQKAEEDNTDLLLLVQELNTAIDKAISQLPPKTQTIFRLSRLEQHSNKEISLIMDLSEKAVEYHITQSLKSLRFYLKDFMLFDLLLVLFLSNF